MIQILTPHWLVGVVEVNFSGREIPSVPGSFYPWGGLLVPWLSLALYSRHGIIIGAALSVHRQPG